MKLFKRFCFIMLPVLILAASSLASTYRLRGSIGARAYGFEDYASENHLWIIQSTRFSLYQQNTPWSLHFSGGYLGDKADDFSNSGSGRLLKAYLQYGGLNSRISGRAGRFFLYRGVALGVIDGMDLGYKINRNLSLNIFAGLSSPYSRNFEIEKLESNRSFGSMVSFTPSDCKIASKGKLSVSYFQQEREQGITRKLIGLNSHFKWNNNITLLNNTHLRPGGNVLRKHISRIRYNNPNWSLLAETGVLKPDIPDYSWFQSIGLQTKIRNRLNLQKYFLGNKWAGGIEISSLNSQGKSGLRAGPTLSTPWGSAGYRFSEGDFANSSGFWLHLRYQEIKNLELYAFSSFTSYEWDAFDIETDDLLMVNAGARIIPWFMPDMRINAEFQIYQTPEFDQDKRVLTGIEWRFDTAGAK